MQSKRWTHLLFLVLFAGALLIPVGVSAADPVPSSIDGIFLMREEDKVNAGTRMYFVQALDSGRLYQLIFTDPSRIPRLAPGTRVTVTGGLTNPTITTTSKVLGSQYALSGLKWANPNVSVSLAPDGAIVTDSYPPSELFANMNAKVAPAVWQREIAKGLQYWASVSNLNFHFVSDNGDKMGTSGSAQGDSRFGDIRIFMVNETANGILGTSWYPAGYGTMGGDSFLNSAYNFQVGNTINLWWVVMHEMGHSIGLLHSDVSTAVMYPTYHNMSSGLDPDDIAGIQAIYGARNKDSFDSVASNDTSGTASALTLTSNAANINADLTTQTDVDFYKVVAPAALNSIKVTLDASAISFLIGSISIYDAYQNLLVTVPATTYGQAVVATAGGVIAGQTYYVRIGGTGNGVFDTGAYALKVEFVSNGVDSTPPTVSITAPAAGATVSNNVTISANATDNVAVAGVQFQIDGSNMGSEDVVAPYSINWNSKTVGNGSHTIRAIARDTSNNTTTSSGVSVTVANDAPPTVALAASATPSPVTGATTSLSALGADDNGEANLVYTWSTTGTPPASVSFSANATNAAKNSVATFTKAGAYAFQVTIKDGANQTVTSAVNVTVNQTLTSITVSPASADVSIGANRQFAAVAHDQFSNAFNVAPSFAWSVSGGGNISSNGLFAASTVGGPFTVTATASAINGTAAVNVIDAPDTTAPLISNVGSTDLTMVGARIVWATNETADSQVEYGPSSAYGTATSLDSLLVVDHSVTLFGLQPGTQYHFRVRSKDGAGNLAVLGDFTFTTLGVMSSPVTGSGSGLASFRAFNPAKGEHARVAFQHQESGAVGITVYNKIGQRIYEGSTSLPAGNVQAEWDGANASAGLYIMRVSHDGTIESSKLVLIK